MTEEPALPDVPEGPAPPVIEPPRLSPTERVAEILERFFLEDARLTTELCRSWASATLLTWCGCSAARRLRLMRRLGV
jgi:hypothetical protein